MPNVALKIELWQNRMRVWTHSPPNNPLRRVFSWKIKNMSIDWIDIRWKEKEYFIQSSYKYQLDYWSIVAREAVRDERRAREIAQEDRREARKQRRKQKRRYA
jgi:hypothetical protein